MRDPKVFIRVVLLATISLLGFNMSTSAPKVQAQAACTSGQSCIFIPVVLQRPNGPQMLSPAANEELTVLAPVFRWATPITGRYRIQVSEDATFNAAVVTPDLDTAIRVRDAAQQVTERVANANLDARKTYYWRVGIEEPLDSGNYTFAATQSFTSPQRKDATQAAAVPTLRTPGNNASLRANVADVTLVWNAVPGATYYRVNLDQADGTRVASALVSENQVAFAGVLKKGTNYTWSVKATNLYGWSEFAPAFRFRVQSN